MQLGYLFALFLCWLMSACGCNSQTGLVKNPPFTVSRVWYQEWVAGVQGGGLGIVISIELSDLSEEVRIDSVYFRNMKAAPELQKGENGSHLLIARYETDFNNENDRVMDADAWKEFGNEPPTKKKIPFELKDDETVISFREGKSSVVQNFKISGIVKKEKIHYPGRNKNDFGE